MPPNYTFRQRLRAGEYGAAVAQLLLTAWRVVHESGDADADELAFGEALAHWLLEYGIEVFPAPFGSGTLIGFARTGRAVKSYHLFDLDDAVRGLLDAHTAALRCYLAAPCSSPAPLPTSEASDG